jgi:hypothetical protein
MNLSSSQSNANYQAFIGQNYTMSNSVDLLNLNNTFTQQEQQQQNQHQHQQQQPQQQLTNGLCYTTNFNHLNEHTNKQSAAVINSRVNENESDENDFDQKDGFLSKLENSDSKRQKKLMPIIQNKTSFYQSHYNQSMTGSSISSNSSSTSSSPLSLSSPLHNGVIHFGNQNHINLQLKQQQQQQQQQQNHQVVQSQPMIINTGNYQQNSSNMLSTAPNHHQSFMYSDSNSNNMFSYHSINKIIPMIENTQQQQQKQYQLHNNMSNEIADSSNMDEYGICRAKIKKSKKDPISEYDTELADSIEFELGLKKQNGPRKNSWGNLSYAELITRAIESSCDQRLTLSQIYDWIVKYVPYFKEKFDRTSSAGWKV